MRRTTLIALLPLLLLSGCQMWQAGGSRAAGKNNAFTITPPAGWMYATAAGPELLASREGPMLQKLWVEKIDLAKPPKGTKTVLRPGMTPFEAAEAMVGELSSDSNLIGLKVKENTPAQVSGRPGFKLVFNYRTRDKLHLMEARYGVLVNNQLWLVRYAAPARHYFERDAAAFEAAAATFQLATSS